MSRKFRHVNIKQPPRYKNESQRENPSVGSALCPHCRSQYEKKSWKHVAARKWYTLLRGHKGAAPVQVMCPACAMKKEHLFEGEIVITNIPQEFLLELRRLIERFTERAEGRSSLHRLLTVEGEGGGLRVTTSENQLAGRLSKKIVESFKHHVELRRSFSREPYEKEFVRLNFAEDRALRNSR